MDSFKKSWTMEMAMAVLENKTIDSETWSDAVEWLLLYGPPEIRELLGQACYHIDDIAESLGITREEAIQKMTELEEIHGFRHMYDDDETLKIQ